MKNDISNAIKSLFITLMLIALYLAGIDYISEFDELFVGLSIDLPFFSQLIIDTYKYWFILPLCSAFILIDNLFFKKLKHSAIVNIMLVVFSILLIPITWYALLLPVKNF